MSATTNAPVIIKRKRVVAGDGHHGGAWKVAYADFVTAMMAFFMLMWLLNATTEKQRKGIADYFSPTIPIAKISGGGEALLNGMSQGNSRDGEQPNSGLTATDRSPAQLEADRLAETAAMNDLEDVLLGRGGESLVSDELKRHVITEITDEGLVIQLFDREDALLFERGTDTPRPLARALADMLARVLSRVDNSISVESHTRAWAHAVAQDRAWPLSMTRANGFRDLMERGGLDAARVERVVGHGNREPASLDPLSMRNNRIKVIVLRENR